MELTRRRPRRDGGGVRLVPGAAAKRIAAPAPPDTYAAGVWELAQVNVAEMRAPITSAAMADFVSAFDPIARCADSSPGFVWRLKSEPGHATVATDGGMDQVVNLSVWQDYASLHQFVYRSAHGRILLRRAKWFRPATQPFVALWWIPVGDRPTVEQALARLSVLRRYGPSPRAFSMRDRFDPDGHPIRRRPLRG